jgi:hypothetical protein
MGQLSTTARPRTSTLVESTPFSRFVRDASPAEKVRVFDRVLAKACERQMSQGEREHAALRLCAKVATQREGWDG